MAQSMDIGARMKWAKRIALEQLDHGVPIANADTLRGVLKQEAQGLGLPSAFDALSDKDLVDVALSVMNHGRSGAKTLSYPLIDLHSSDPGNEAAVPGNAYMKHGALTPPPSLGADERVDEAADEQDGKLTFDPADSQFDMNICNQLNGHIYMLTARHCKQKGCYIRADVLERYGLLPCIEKNKIRLSWRKNVPTNQEPPRTPSSMFRVVSEACLEYDIAISKTWEDDKDVDKDDDISGEEKEESIGERIESPQDGEVELGTDLRRLSISESAHKMSEGGPSQWSDDTIRNAAKFHTQVVKQLFG